jgi:hypothetical protein
MNPSTGSGFKIIGDDNVVYGPVELPTLVEWIKDQRVTPATWVYNEDEDAWRRARDRTELAPFLQPAPVATHEINPEEPPIAGLQPALLRRVRVLSQFSHQELCRFMELSEVRLVLAAKELVKKGEPGDAMYLIVDGELRVRMMVDGKETVLTTLLPGDSFGEMTLFDHGPTPTDVVANIDSTVLKISAPAFQRLLQEAPELAAPFLLGMGKALTSRTRATNKRRSPGPFG